MPPTKTAKNKIQIPYNFIPRSYQLAPLEAFDSGYTRGVWLAHRRAGKDKTCINLIAKKMLERVGTYFYILPTYQQGRKIIWNGMDGHGFKFTDHIPHELRTRTNDQLMLIELKNGSIFQVIGTDNVDSLVGTNPVGCVFSEYPLQQPDAWAYLRPILRENKGFAMFVYTPRGKNNHGYDLWELANDNPDEWWSMKMSVDDTNVLSKEELEKERKEYIQQYGDDSIYQQEYFCDFNATLTGTYFNQQMEIAESEQRLTVTPYDPQLPVHTAWDLGVGDATSIWFAQIYNNEIRLIDYYEAQGEGLQHYIQVLQNKKYVYGNHYAPHDIAVREMSTGISRLETARRLGIKFQITPRLSLEDGIHAIRTILNRCWFDKEKTKRGIECLRNYRKEYNEKMREYKSTPVHDEFSHGVDAFRYLAVSLSKHQKKEENKDKRVSIPTRSINTYRKNFR